MVSVFIDIPDPFYERMGLKKHNNNYGDLVDDVDDLVMHGSQVNSTMASSIHLVAIPNLSMPCGVYSIEHNTKYSIAKRGSTNAY